MTSFGNFASFRALGLGLLCFVLSAAGWAAERHVAPEAKGDGSGASPERAAGYLDAQFWKQVDVLARQEPVTVRLAAAHYSRGQLTLSALGNERHRITIVGEGSGAIFDSAADSLLFVRGCRNLHLKNLHFTGMARKFAVTVAGITAERKDAIIPVNPNELNDGTAENRDGEDIMIEGCSWIDLRNVFYGALCLSSHTHHITVRDCTFKRVGLERHAHMMYNGDGSHHLFILNNTFEDCSGSYVRFRNRSDYGYVFGNSFRSTGTMPTEDASTSTFLQIPLYNSFDPGAEVFGTNFYVIGNSFTWAADPVKRDVQDPVDQINFHSRDALRFHQGGFETKGYHTLLSKDEGYTLRLGAPSAKEPILRAAGIYPERIVWFGNSYAGPMMHKVAYGCLSEFGAFPKSRGFDTYAEITNVLTQRELFRESFERGTELAEHWTAEQAPGTSITATLRDATEGRRSLLLSDQSAEGVCSLRRDIDPAEGLYFSAWFYFLDNTADHLCLADGDRPLVVAGRSGYWENDRGRCIGNAAYVPGRWYHLEATFEQGAQDYNIWIDGVLISKDIKDPVIGPVRRFAGPIVLSPASRGGQGAMLVDDIRVATLGEQEAGVRLVSAQAIAPDTLRVTFSEPVDRTGGDTGAQSALNPLNYMVSNRFFPAFDLTPLAVTAVSATTYDVKLNGPLNVDGGHLWLTTIRGHKGRPLSPRAHFIAVSR